MINEKYKNELSNIKSVSNMREQFKEFCTSVRTRLSTGYLNLDFLLGGGLTDELYVFGAPTSSGKTAFLMSIAQNLAKAGVYVLYFTFVHGIGRRKSAIQKSIESLEIYIGKLKKYIHKLYACGERNSYSKTDPDATFMRMKEDHMLNGQLKPAYNLQHGVDSEYITWLTINPNPTDTKTLIPFLKDMEQNLGFKYTEIVADAGYESEENYLFIEANGQTAFIKPNNYEISKKRRFKTDIGKMENMDYDKENDFYICKNNRKLTAQYEKKGKTATGYRRTTTVYKCSDCSGCPYKTDCIKGNNCKTSMEQRNKTLYVSKTMKQKRAEDLERITSPYGIQLRVNRSIQAEGSFASVKEDMEFRRYMYRGKENVTAQSVILAIAHNINKLHNKIQSEKTGQHLFRLKETA